MRRLRDLREDRDLKQADIARVLHISQQYYQRYESGKNELPLRHAVTLAKFYNVSLDYIAGLSPLPHPLLKNGSNPTLVRQTHLLERLEAADPKTKKAILALLEE